MEAVTQACTSCSHGIKWQDGLPERCGDCDGAGLVAKRSAPETQVCSYCLDGVDWKSGAPQRCSVCQGAGVVDDGPIEFRVEPEPLTDGQAETMADRNAQFLDERGIKARPSIRQVHLLPHEGGQRSKEGQELEALLAQDEARKAKLSQKPPASVDESCLHCVDGTDWKTGSPRECKVCHGTGEAFAKLDQPQGIDQDEPTGNKAETSEERVAEYLASRGIKARAGIRPVHLLPHEGGKCSREGQELEALIAQDEERKANALERPDEPEPDVCLYCHDGADWRSGSAEKCALCLGTGRIILSEDEKIRNGVETLASIKDMPEDVMEPVDVLVKRFNEATEGSKAPPGVREVHLLPHEGGKRSREGQELEAEIALYEELKTKALELLGDLESDVCIDCQDGTDWRSGPPEKCSRCQGTGRAVLSDNEKLRKVMEFVASMQYRPEPVTAPMDVLGDEASSDVRSAHLLPHESGQRSREGQELEAEIALYEERKAKYGQDYWYYAKVNGW